MKLAIWMSSFLATEEREAVLGDLQEVQSRSGRAFLEVASLVVRRQAALWHDWQPWLVLLFFVLPVGMLLTLSALESRSNLDLYIWILRNYRDMDPSLLRSTGLNPAHGILLIGLRWLLVAMTSWTNGVVLGALARRTIVFTGLLFLFVLLSGESVLILALAGPGQEAVDFWTFVIPSLLLIALVIIPSTLGTSQGMKAVHGRLVSITLWASAICVPGLFYWLLPRLRPSSEPLVFVFWPLGFAIAQLIRNRVSIRTTL